ncbi:MAG: hypothetical protein Ta2D_11360 [Rickettsiales bacterium]|nr:MAG: hypothetical protein Ta2D_11360 [Rickettsiales bacterium]
MSRSFHKRTNNRNYYYIAYILISFYVMTTSFKEPMSFISLKESVISFSKPFFVIVDFPFILLEDGKNIIKTIFLVKKENDELITKNKELKTQNTQSQLLIEENKKLKQMLKLKEIIKKEYKTLVGNTYIKNNKIMINLGSNDGITELSLVIGENNGVIGRIVDIMPEYSIVLPITDLHSYIPVKTKTTGEKFLAKGINNSFVMETDLFRTNKPIIVEGDLVFTDSNPDFQFDSFFVGKIMLDAKKENIYVEIFEDINKINFVTILINEID